MKGAQHFDIESP